MVSVVWIGAIALSLMGLGAFVVAYIRMLLIPISREALQLMRLHRRQVELTARIEQGAILVGSPAYWNAIEQLIPVIPVNDTR